MSTSRKNKSKGQTALEFLTVVVFLTLVFTGAYTVLLGDYISTSERRVRQQAQATADQISYELDFALAQGKGYKRQFEIRREIRNSPYNVTVEKGFVKIQWINSTVLSSTVLQNITGDIEPGLNRILNRGGDINASQP